MALRRSLLLLIALILPTIAFATTKHVVTKGDNLYDLSRKFGVSVEDIKTFNKLDSNNLDVGDELLIPESNLESNNNYVVKSGDTISQIAEKFGVKTKDLKSSNKLKNNNLQIGQTLYVPGQKGSTNTEAALTEDITTPSTKEGKSASSDKILKETPAIHTVKNGDTLGHIVEKHYVNLTDLRKVNELKNYNLKIVQVPALESKEKITVSPKKEKPTQTISINNEYVVKKGDTLEYIAERLDVSSADLRKINGLKNDKLNIGQVLTIPNSDKTAALPTPEKPTKTISEYVVKKGDTLGEIAEKNGVKTNDLKKANNLKNHSLQIGQRLVIPNSHIVTKDISDAKNEAASTKTEVKKTNQHVSKNNPDPGITVSNLYAVQKGDTIYDLSTKFKISKDNLKKWNNLDNNNLSIGQKLFLTPNKEIKTASNKSVKKISKPKYSENYTIKKGDTLGHIAVKFDISVANLKSANDLTNNNLSIGKVLKVPALTKQNKATAKKAKTGPKKTLRVSKTKYVVKKGDTLGGISNRYGVSVGKIKQASSLRNDRINIGDVLVIPGIKEKTTTSKYTVVTGDTLGAIGSKFGVSVRELKDTNNLTKNNLYVGMKLLIPSNLNIRKTSTQTAKKPVQTKSTKYIVRRGDTLGLIAKRHRLSVGSIKSANNIKGNSIRAGQTITLPGTAKYRVQEKQTTYSSKNKSTKESIIATAKQYLGAPYKFGGYSFKTGIDCSGYVKKIFNKFNVELPRTARDIYYNAGTRVAKSQLQTGDLVFFRTYARYPSHVGIYMGNNLFIHASSGARKVAITRLDKKYYSKRYIGAKRIKLSAIFEKEYSQR